MGTTGIFLLFNCQTPAYGDERNSEVEKEEIDKVYKNQEKNDINI